MPDFVKLFDFLLQQTKTETLHADTHEGNTLELLRLFWIRLLMLIVVSALQASSMLVESQVDISMLFARIVRWKDALSINVWQQNKSEEDR